MSHCLLQIISYQSWEQFEHLLIASNVGPVLLCDNQTGPNQQQEEKRIGEMGCKLDKTKMETKSTEICAASKWYPIGGGGGMKTTCNALLLIFKEKKTSTTTTRDQFPGRAASQWVTFLGFFAEKYFTC